MSRIVEHKNGGLYQVIGAAVALTSGQSFNDMEVVEVIRSPASDVFELVRPDPNAVHDSLVDVIQAKVQCATPVANGADMTLYRGEDAAYWVCPTTEFEDGRFKTMYTSQPAAPAPVPPAVVETPAAPYAISNAASTGEEEQ